MKTTVKTIAAGLFLATSVFGLNATENLLTPKVLVEVIDYELELESWMSDVDNFNSKTEFAASNFVNVDDYELNLESWMTEVDNFNTEKSEVEEVVFINVSDYSLELESWMSDGFGRSIERRRSVYGFCADKRSFQSPFQTTGS